MMKIARVAARLAAVVAAVAGLAALAGGMLAAPAAAQSACGPSVSVAPGDTLGRIAARCGTTIAALLQANPQISNPNAIFVGQTIRMPGAASVQPRPPFAPPSPPPAAVGTYVVRPGDTLAAIADRLGIPLAQLISANPNVDPRFVWPGLALRVPGDLAPPQRAASLVVEPGQARQGSRVALTARGLPPGSNARILGGASPDDLTVLERASVDGRGRLRADIAVLDWAPPGRPFYFAVETRWPPAQALAEPIRVAWGGRWPGRSPDVAVTGTLTREGVECPALRGDDGRLYTLAGEFRRFRPGERVRVEGRPAELSICMQGTTIEVRHIQAIN